MTQDDLKTLYQRAMQYCVNAYGKEPDNLIIEENGSFCAKWNYFNYNTGAEDEYEYFTIENLSEDLDAVYAERKKKENEAAEKQRLENIEREKRYQQQQKEERKRQYEKLKKEFE